MLFGEIWENVNKTIQKRIKMKEKNSTEKETSFCQIGSLVYRDIGVHEAAEYIRKAAKEQRFLAVFTPGAVAAAKAEREKETHHILSRGDLILPDGVGCRIAARLSGKKLRHVTPGIEVGEALMRLGNRDGMRVFLYGGREGVARDAAKRLSERFPRLVLATANGYGSSPLEEILRFRPHFLLVCLGFPKQENWILAHKERLSFPCLALGGSLDVYAGRLRRAPLFFRRMGLEWVWRTAREPKRIGRLLPLPRYFLGCARDGIRHLLQNFQKSMKKRV